MASRLDPRQQGVGPCAATGCDRLSGGWHRFCSRHHYLHHTHGHHQQQPIRLAYLSNTLKQIARYEKTDEGKRAIDMIVSHYKDGAKMRIGDFDAAEARVLETGVRHNHWDHQANSVISQVYRSKDHATAVRQLLALGASFVDQPYFFRSDRSLNCAATHVYMAGSDALLVSRYDHRKQKVMSKRRHIAVKARDALGSWLVSTVVVYGAHMARHWQSKQDHARQQEKAIIAALKAG